jgi:hypothetical protein
MAARLAAGILAEEHTGRVPSLRDRTGWVPEAHRGSVPLSVLEEQTCEQGLGLAEEVDIPGQAEHEMSFSTC